MYTLKMLGLTCQIFRDYFLKGAEKLEVPHSRK